MIQSKFLKYICYFLILLFIILIIWLFRPLKIDFEKPYIFLNDNLYFSLNDLALAYHSKHPSILNIYRLGKEKTKIISLNLPAHDRSNTKYDLKKGFNWDTNLSIGIGKFKSGYYYIELIDSHTHEFSIYPFIKIPEKNALEKIVIVAPTNTWNAYNNFVSGYYSDSHHLPLHKKIKAELRRYLGEITDLGANYKLRFKNLVAFPLPQKRPTIIANDLKILEKASSNSFSVSGEWNLITFLEEHNYEYSVISDYQLAFHPEYLNTKVLIMNTHSEYWSDEMSGNLNLFLHRGGKAIIASGNNMYRKYRFTEDGGQVIKAWNHPSETAKLMGTSYTVDGYNSFAGFRKINSNHWVLQNVPDNFGMNRASGMETDKINIFTPENITILAVGKNTSGPAFMVFYDTGAKGWLFNASSVSFTCSLDDPGIKRILFNLLNEGIA